MQTDMHYYGTYAIARAAGLTPDACRTIAYASQFIDDNAGHMDVFAKDGGHLHVTATAHHTANSKNLDKADQHLVWVPYHFLPGAEGDTYEEKLVCVKNSHIAREMMDYYINYEKQPFLLHLLGIAAHIYVDTFSHYGFSGISSPLNEIKQDTLRFDEKLSTGIKHYLSVKFKRFKEKIQADFTEELSRGLGHGAVHTYPDRPYLRWSFTYEDGRNSVRSNPDTFLEACENLHHYFQQFAAKHTEHTDSSGKPFSDIRDTVRKVLAVSEKKDKRIQAWQQAAQKERLLTGNESIPMYDAQEWLMHFREMEAMENSADMVQKDGFCFLQAAALHRSYVLRQLLPKHGLLVR